MMLDAPSSEHEKFVPSFWDRESTALFWFQNGGGPLSTCRVGGVTSTVQANAVGATFPRTSVAVTVSVCAPSLTFARSNVPAEQSLAGRVSTWHVMAVAGSSERNSNDALLDLVTASGAESNFTPGPTLSTRNSH